MPYRLIEHCSSEDVAEYRSLKGNQGQFAKGLFIAESPKIVEIMLRSNVEIISAFLTPEYLDRFEPGFAGRNGETRVYVAPKLEMEKIVGYQLHQGVMLACRIPESLGFQEFQLRSQPFTIVALDGIADAENMGAIIRNCAAFGIDGILFDGRSCDPYLRRSVRVSMGTVVNMSFIRVDDLAEALRVLKREETRIIAATLTDTSQPLTTVELARNTVVVFGAEGWGIRKEVLSGCDVFAAIPISSQIDSLNVAVANGIFLYALSTLSIGKQ